MMLKAKDAPWPVEEVMRCDTVLPALAKLAYAYADAMLAARAPKAGA
jgi:hypothetical protein